MLKAKREGDFCRLTLDEGDYGIGVEVTIKNYTFDEKDEIVITIRNRDYDREIVLEKRYSTKGKTIQDNKFYFIISEQESKLFKEELYSWEMELYRDKKFLLTITQSQEFVVEGGI